MTNIHCTTCGGFISDVERVSYQRPSDISVVASPKSQICGCSLSVILGPPPGHASSPGMDSVARRN